jgi:DNA invertase Pin-like site-specific DNA recombinase
LAEYAIVICGSDYLAEQAANCGAEPSVLEIPSRKSQDQRLDLQLKSLKKIGCQRILREKVSGVSRQRPEFQCMPWASTTTHAGKMIMTVFADIAEFEKDSIRERTGPGRKATKQRGVRFGRPRKLTARQAQVAAQLLSGGKPVRDIARTFNVHEATIGRLAGETRPGWDCGSRWAVQ